MCQLQRSMHVPKDSCSRLVWEGPGQSENEVRLLLSVWRLQFWASLHASWLGTNRQTFCAVVSALNKVISSCHSNNMLTTDVGQDLHMLIHLTYLVRLFIRLAAYWQSAAAIKREIESLLLKERRSLVTSGKQSKVKVYCMRYYLPIVVNSN